MLKLIQNDLHVTILFMNFLIPKISPNEAIFEYINEISNF